MKSILISIFYILTCTGISLAQDEAEPIVDKEMKIQFSAPDGWKVTKKTDGYLMGSPNTNGFMLIKVQNFATIKDLKSAMKKGIKLEDGTELTPDGDINMLGSMGVSGIYLGTIDGTEMKGFLMALMPPSKGRAAICISVAPISVFNQSNMDELKILLRSVTFL